MMKSLFVYRQETDGVAALEFALMLPFLSLTCFATMDASYLILQNHKMETSLTAAGTYLARSSDPQAHELAAKRLAVTGQTTSGGTPVIANWSVNDITLAYKNVTNTPTQDGLSYRGGATIGVVQLSSQFQYQGLGFLKSVRGGNITITAKHEERITGAVS